VSIRQTSYLGLVPFVPRLGHSDLDGALALVGEAAATNGKQPFELQSIQHLLELIPADRAGYYEALPDQIGNLYFVDQPTVEDEIDWCSEEIAGIIWSWPLFEGHIRATPDIALKLSDFLTRSQLRRNAWYNEMQRTEGVEHEIKLWLPAPKGMMRGFFLLRGPGSPDFDERDRGLLTILRPHLSSIRERWERQRRPSALTDREIEVLELVAEGLTNREIAGRLVVSPTTIRTHLEHIFEKLGVHTRTAAVAAVRNGDRAH
jgi:DNA-binding CsgD family transcriptional regulator